MVKVRISTFILTYNLLSVPSSVKPNSHLVMKIDGVKRELIERGMSVEKGSMIVHDGGEWKAVVNA